MKKLLFKRFSPWKALVFKMDFQNWNRELLLSCIIFWNYKQKCFELFQIIISLKVHIRKIDMTSRRSIQSQRSRRIQGYRKARRICLHFYYKKTKTKLQNSFWVQSYSSLKRAIFDTGSNSLRIGIVWNIIFHVRVWLIQSCLSSDL